VCPGSFDPITNGHLDVIARAAAIFDEVVVAVGQNSTKSYLFSADERIELVRESLAHLTNVTVDHLDGLIVDFVNARGGGVLVKGIRFAGDFEFELQMANLNKLVGGVETLILPAASQWSTLRRLRVRPRPRSEADPPTLAWKGAVRWLSGRRRCWRSCTTWSPEPKGCRCRRPA
jgi:pantetheine-phosphate adenylyltransferase